MTANDDISRTAYNYGRYFEKRRRAIAGSEAHKEYDALCMALYRELRDVDAMTRFSILQDEYLSDFQAGRDSVGEY